MIQLLKKPKGNLTLADTLDKVIETGAAVVGDVTLNLADIDLVYVGLRLVVTSSSKMGIQNHNSTSNIYREPTIEEVRYMDLLEREIEKTEKAISNLNKLKQTNKTEQGLARLVLIVVNLIKSLLEKEVQRRIKQNTLGEVEIQKLGLTFMAFDKKVEELKLVFNIKDEEMNLDLGPLGKIM